ncbi:MAG: TPM domain-containing protein [Candidatus Cloacimonetes bacterium]|nr:TPM domain-containing protein [Candidatus Cloacimonadota bacterium]
MIKKIIVFCLLILSAVNLVSIAIPQLKGRINDYAGILTKQEEKNLENILYTNELKTSSEIALLIIPTLEGDNLESFAMKVVEKWKLGKDKQDNGALLLIVMDDRKVRLEVGNGLDPILTDIISGFIIRDYIVENFKSGDYYTGINYGLKAITGIISEEFTIDPEELEKYRKSVEKNNKSNRISLVALLFVISLIFGLFRGRRRGSIIPFIIFGSMRNRSGSGFSGGGFRRFSGGGGSFGGGGASGGW